MKTWVHPITVFGKASKLKQNREDWSWPNTMAMSSKRKLSRLKDVSVKLAALNSLPALTFHVRGWRSGMRWDPRDYMENQLSTGGWPSQSQQNIVSIFQSPWAGQANIMWKIKISTGGHHQNSSWQYSLCAWPDWWRWGRWGEIDTDTNCHPYSHM